MLMYRHAYKKSEELQLNEIEKFDTKTKITSNMLMAIVPLISVAIAMIFHWTWMGGMFAGFTYMLYTPIMFIHGHRSDKKRKAFLLSLQADTLDSAPVPEKVA
jgi:uncharacterized membrane protein (DUF106 family)